MFARVLSREWSDLSLASMRGGDTRRMVEATSCRVEQIGVVRLVGVGRAWAARPFQIRRILTQRTLDLIQRSSRNSLRAMSTRTTQIRNEIVGMIQSSTSVCTYRDHCSIMEREYQLPMTRSIWKDSADTSREDVVLIKACSTFSTQDRYCGRRKTQYQNGVSRAWSYTFDRVPQQ